MRCQACQDNLSDREASRKYLSWREIANPEQRFIGLCDECVRDTGLLYEEDVRASDEKLQDEGATTGEDALDNTVDPE